jgi:sugar/nucleoside kinase (ribokinase family)
VYGVGQISLDRVWVGAPAAQLDAAALIALAPEQLPKCCGGQVATALLALAKLGCRAAWAGALGDDAAADAAVAPLVAAGVDCTDAQRVQGGRTRRALIAVDRESAEREVVPERDPRVRLEPQQLCLEHIAASRSLLVDAEDIPASLAAAVAASAAGRPVVLDAERPSDGLDALLAQTDFPIVSRPLADFLGKGSARKGLQVLASRARRAAVVTLGPEGAIAARNGRDEVIMSPAFPVAARDTTGAGDAFHAGFILALIAGADFETTLRTANAVAALNCEALGAQGGLPDRKRLTAFLAGHPVG